MGGMQSYRVYGFFIPLPQDHAELSLASQFESGKGEWALRPPAYSVVPPNVST